MNKIVVFGNCLQNTVGLVRSMGEEGYKVDLLIEPCRKSDCFIRLSKYVNEITYLDRLEDAVDVLLQKYGNEPERTVVLCGSDPTISLLDSKYDRIKDKFFVFNANGEQGRINYFLDKNNVFKIAEKCGLTLIRTRVVNDIHNLPDGIEFPCFIKGGNSVKSTKGDIHICNSYDEIRSSLREGVEYFFQDYIQKDSEISVTGFSYNHGRNVLLPGVIRKIREDLVRMGEYMVLDDISAYPNVNIEGIKQLVREIGYEGIFSVDFLCEDEKCYFLEINLRNDGLAYMFTAAGANYPLLWLKYITGHLTDEDVSSVRLKTPFYLMHENDMYNIVEGKVGLWQWMKDFCRSDAFFIMNWRDPMPFVGSTLVHARQACKKVARKLFGINIK